MMQRVAPPTMRDGYLALSHALRDQQAGRLVEAEEGYRQILRAYPNHPDALQLLGVLHSQRGRNDLAVAFIQKAIALKPAVSSFHVNLGSALLTQGRLEDAVASFRHALAIDPTDMRAHSNLLVPLHYIPGYSREALLAEARTWGERHAGSPAAPRHPHRNDARADRRLRIGYVAAEFFRHPVGYFLLPVLLEHDKGQVEIYCYGTGLRTDDLTTRLRAAADQWRNLEGVGDEVAAMIDDDGIDILVDLSWHLGAHRLPLFARKPAPVQATWISCFDTSGVSSMDYIVADGVVAPERDDAFFVEQVVRLPDAYECYVPPDPMPDVAAAPALQRGHVTFGCFNRIAKVNTGVIAVWAEVLRRLPDARLSLRSGSLDDRSVRARYLSMFAAHGIRAERITLGGPASHAETLAAYHSIDIALDPFPYNGCTTTAEALWMGVLVVALRGDRFVGRASASFLTATGLGQLVAESEEEYVALAVALASDVSRLAELRAGLQQQVAQSALCDAPRFTRQPEAAYRAMWRGWCRAQHPWA